MKLSDLNLLNFGHKIQLAGAIYTEHGKTYLVPFPDEDLSALQTKLVAEDIGGIDVLEMNQDDWAQLLRQTDLLETEILQQAADKTITKAIIRKSIRQIEQHVSWGVFDRDGYRCRYCGKGGGTPLTVDHLVTWESGGPSTMENLVSACRKCNKVRGDLPYEKWLLHNYYLSVRMNLTEGQRLANTMLQTTLDKIPLRVHQRSR